MRCYSSNTTGGLTERARSCFSGRRWAVRLFFTNPQTADRLLLDLCRNNYRIMCPQYADASAPKTPRNRAFCAPSSPRKSESSTGALAANLRVAPPECRIDRRTVRSGEFRAEAPLKCRSTSAGTRKRPQNAEPPRASTPQPINPPQSRPSEVTNRRSDALRNGGTVENTSNILTIKEVAAILRCSKAHALNVIDGKVPRAAQAHAPQPRSPQGRPKRLARSMDGGE
jgi:hypothetical protein